MKTLNEEVFVLWADRVSDNLSHAIKKAKYKGKSNKNWNDQYKLNAKEGHGTVFFINASNVDEAKRKILMTTEKNKKDTNFYVISENIKELQK